MPRTTLGVGNGLNEVCTEPLASVRRSVTAVGVGVAPGRVVTFNFWTTTFRISSMSGVYVEVARSVIARTEVGTEVLNVYGGVVKLGVDTTKFGRVVGTVSVRDEKKAESEAGVIGSADAGRSG